MKKTLIALAVFALAGCASLENCQPYEVAYDPVTKQNLGFVFGPSKLQAARFDRRANANPLAQAPVQTFEQVKLTADFVKFFKEPQAGAATNLLPRDISPRSMAH